MGKRSILRAPSGGSVSYEEWRDEAACKGVDPQLFELGEAVGRGKGEDEEELIAWGLRICSKCPVRKPCGASASEMDKYWSTRGGQPPEGLFPDSEQPDSVPRGTARGPKEFCIRGHQHWSVTASGVRYCVPCRKQADQRGMEKRRARTAAKKAARLAG